MTTPLSSDHFLAHDELTALVHAWAAEHPSLVEVASIGRSHEGRDIWLLSVTDRATGPAAEKPALWVEANIHSTELMGSYSALHLVHHLLARASGDERVERALRTRAVYVVPRLNPDGAEAALSTPPRYTRSSVRNWPPPWPGPAPEPRGLLAEDVDGDGRILMMRVVDPNGAWKADVADPRLLVARDPDEEGGGPYYRLLTEGRVHRHDGLTIPDADDPAGLDLNRNWPYDWAPRAKQHGAGPYPTSEPEVGAAVRAMTDRPNLCGYIAYHTFSGVHLRPYSARADDTMLTFDLRVYRDLGTRLTGITGYPNLSVFHDYKYDLQLTEHGLADDWAYEHLGLLAWTWEIWNVLDAAGIARGYHYIEWLNDHPIDDDRALLAWADAELDGEGYVDWYPFDHPELGPVELGGWQELVTFRNPPPARREAEAARMTEAALLHCLVSPRLELRSSHVDPVSGDGDRSTWRVRVVVENTGWLPTNVTEKAVEQKAVAPAVARIALPDGARLAAGIDTVELGQLSGRVLKRQITRWGHDPTSDRAVAEWVVVAAAGSAVVVEVRHPRAGVVRTTVTLPER